MEKLRYSIIYAVIRPEISERISVGLITIADGTVDIRYSESKLKALEHLYPKAKYEFISKVVRSMPKQKQIHTAGDIDYLTRYCNNMISISQLQTIDMKPDKKNKEWLYRNYVYSAE